MVNLGSLRDEDRESLIVGLDWICADGGELERNVIGVCCRAAAIVAAA